MAREKFMYAGETVKIKESVKPSTGVDFAGKDFIIEDWWENVSGESWMFADNSMAAWQYAIHVASNNLPLDNEVVYGKIDGLGYILHVSELELPEDDK